MKSFLLIGVGTFGTSLAHELHDLGHQVLVVDRREEKVNGVLPVVNGGRVGDGADERFLESMDVKSFDVCLVTIGDFKSLLETTANLKKMGAAMVISRAGDDSQAISLLRSGADEIIYPEKQIAKWAALRYGSEQIRDYIAMDGSHAILEASVPAQWCGKTVVELELRQRYGLNVLAVKEKGQLDVAITPDTVLTDSRTMMVLGEYSALKQCFHG